MMYKNKVTPHLVQWQGDELDCVKSRQEIVKLRNLNELRN